MPNLRESKRFTKVWIPSSVPILMLGVVGEPQSAEELEELLAAKVKARILKEGGLEKVRKKNNHEILGMGADGEMVAWAMIRSTSAQELMRRVDWTVEVTPQARRKELTQATRDRYLQTLAEASIYDRAEKLIPSMIEMFENP